MNKMDNVCVARVSTIAFFVFTQLRTQLEALTKVISVVHIVASKDELENNLNSIEGCIFNPLAIERDIDVKKDLIALYQLWKFFRKERVTIVHSTTPKAGLLCAIAAKLAGTSICIHTFTGQAWVTMNGPKKYLLRWSDKLIGLLNICCYTDSSSQRDFLIENRIIQSKKIKILGKGSLAGVNLERFSATNITDEEKKSLKKSLNISLGTKIVLFVGRITKEKGIFELFEAMQQLGIRGHNAVLIVAGPFEQNNEEEIRTAAAKLCGDKVLFVGFQPDPERYMAISEVLCLPSYREGFGTVVIEAAAMGVPVVGSKIYGLTDAVVDGVTGILVEPRNSMVLADALQHLLTNEEVRVRMGEEARARAVREFDSTKCSALLIEEYKHLLAHKHSVSQTPG